MSNVRVTTPSFVFGYWRPWNENSNLTESYLNYVKDVSLVKYGADVVGKYVKEASQEQVNAISKLGNKIGSGFDMLSNRLDDVNEELRFLNANTEILIEQQKLSNILLEDIIELLRVPDSEKERQHAIELGIKFFVNAQKDHTLFDDALEQLQKAEALMKQDYLVLHKIGCIHLYVEKHLDIKKAKDYFLRSAKYSSVENSEDAINLANILTNNSSSNTKRYKDIDDFIDEIKFENYPELHKSNILKISYDKTNEEIIVAKKNGQNKLIDIIPLSELKQKINFALNSEIQLIIDRVNEINAGYQNPSNAIDILTADSYQKAAFCSYILGEFTDAVNIQNEATRLVKSAENLFLLSKYEARSKQTRELISHLSLAIDMTPELALAVFKEIDLLNTPEVLQLLEKKNIDINNKIDDLIAQWKTINSKSSLKQTSELEALKSESFEKKIHEYHRSVGLLKKIQIKINQQKQLIDGLISSARESIFCSPINEIIDKLNHSKEMPLEQMELVYRNSKVEIKKEKVQIGSQYQGGIVFHLDNNGKHGLICAENIFESAVWGGDGIKCTTQKLGSGKNNTTNINKNAGTKTKDSVLFLATGLTLLWFFWGGIKQILLKSDVSIPLLTQDGIYWGFRLGIFAFIIFSVLFIGSKNKTKLTTAAELCLKSTHNGFNDWYLPSIEELELIHKNLYSQGKLENLIEQTCWSSSEYIHDSLSIAEKYANAYCLKFNKTSIDRMFDKRLNKNGVLMIRSF